MKETIERLVQKYSSMVLQIAYQYSFNKSEAEDITQEVFIKLYNNIKKIKNEEHIKAWLIRVTINLSIDYNRNYWNKNTTSLDENYKYFDEESIPHTFNFENNLSVTVVDGGTGSPDSEGKYFGVRKITTNIPAVFSSSNGAILYGDSSPKTSVSTLAGMDGVVTVTTSCGQSKTIRWRAEIN